MPAYAVLGAQWGYEGKGKIVDYLEKGARVVARFAGGNNAVLFIRFFHPSACLSLPPFGQRGAG